MSTFSNFKKSEQNPTLSNFEISEEFFRRLQETGIEGREREGELQQNYIFYKSVIPITRLFQREGERDRRENARFRDVKRNP